MVNTESLAIRLGIKKSSIPGMYHCFNTSQHKHGDKDASLSINEKGFNCFGCGVKGNDVEMVKLVLNLDTNDAIKWIKKEFSLTPIDQTNYFKERLGKYNLYNVEYDKNKVYYVYKRYAGHPIDKKVVVYKSDIHRDKNIKPYYTKKAKDKPLFNENLLRVHPKKTVIITESEKSAALAWHLNKDYVWVSMGGANGLTKRRTKYLEGRNVILLYDPDLAGRKSALRDKEKLEGITLSTTIIDLFPKKNNGYDIGDYILENNMKILDISTGKVIINDDDYIYKTEEADKKEKEYPDNDEGNAKVIIDKYGDIVKFSPELRKWMVYQNGVWKDDDLAAERLFRKLSSLRVPYKLKYGNWSYISAAMKAAKSELSKSINDFDPYHSKINLKNCVFDLEDFSVNDHDPKYLMTQMAGVSYNKDATCPMFEEFIDQIFQSDKDLIEFVQMVFGLSITSITKFQKFFILFGEGANGKSTLINIIQHIAGTYSWSAMPDMFLKKHTNTNPDTALAMLVKRRLVYVADLETNARLDEGIIKTITGGEKVTARKLYGQAFEFDNYSKLFFATNDKPSLSGNDYAMRRRTILIPFNYTVPEDKRNYDLQENIINDEAPGVFNWLVQGIVHYMANGFKIPTVIRVGTDMYMSDFNKFKTFYEETYTKTDNRFDRIPTMIVYNHYKDWCKNVGFKSESQVKFSREFLKVHPHKVNVEGRKYSYIKKNDDPNF